MYGHPFLFINIGTNKHEIIQGKILPALVLCYIYGSGIITSSAVNTGYFQFVLKRGNCISTFLYVAVVSGIINAKSKW